MKAYSTELINFLVPLQALNYEMFKNKKKKPINSVKHYDFYSLTDSFIAQCIVQANQFNDYFKDPRVSCF